MGILDKFRKKSVILVDTLNERVEESFLNKDGLYSKPWEEPLNSALSQILSRCVGRVIRKSIVGGETNCELKKLVFQEKVGNTGRYVERADQAGNQQSVYTQILVSAAS